MKVLPVVAQVGFIALCLLPVGRQLVQDWPSIGTLASQVNILAVLGAALLLALSSLALPVALAAFTGGSRRRIGYRDSAVAYYASQPMKYLPGSFWILPGRIVLLRRLGHSATASSGGLLFEMVTQALSASLVAAVLIGGAGLASGSIRASVWLLAAGSLIATVLLLVSPGLVSRIQRLPASVREAAARLAAISPAARLRNLAVTLLASAAMWLVMGASFYLLLVAGSPRLDLALLGTAVGVSTLSWLAGFLSPFSPGGIGVREAAIVLLLAGVVSGPQATLVAVLVRVLALLVEIGFALAASLTLRSARPVRTVRASRPLERVQPRPLERRAATGLGRVADLSPRRALPPSHPC